MSNTTYIPGNWNSHCDICGFRFKASQLKKNWQGLMTCEADYEHDHPQKFLRVTERSPTVPWVRKLSDDSFVYVCKLSAAVSYADYAEADCGRADITFPALADLISST